MRRTPVVGWEFPTRGETYLVLRPTGAFASRFDSLVAEARSLVDGRFAGAHVTLKGWGGQTRATDRRLEPAIAAVVRAWARETSPLELRVVALDLFEEDRIPVLVVEATPELRDAQVRIRERSAAAGLPGNPSDRHEDWIFHASLAYLDDLPESDWARVRAWWAEVPHEPLACTVHEAELVAYDGGPERLLEAVRLGGPVPMA